MGVFPPKIVYFWIFLPNIFVVWDENCLTRTLAKILERTIALPAPHHWEWQWWQSCCIVKTRERSYVPANDSRLWRDVRRDEWNETCSSRVLVHNDNVNANNSTLTLYSAISWSISIALSTQGSRKKSVLKPLLQLLLQSDGSPRSSRNV